MAAVPPTPSARRPWRPTLLDCMPGYGAATFRADLSAGMTVGVVALPLAMAFGIASGATPQAGLYTAIVGGFIVAALGGSRTQVSGPTGAFVVIVAGIIAKHGLSGLLMVTMLAGVMLVGLAVTGLGRAIRFVPRPVVVGFTNGIALLIASTQLRDFFGVALADPPSEFFARMAALWHAAPTASPAAITIGTASLAVILAAPRWLPRVPGSLAAVVIGALVVGVLDPGVDTVGSRFGDLPRGLPALEVPAFRTDLILPLLPSAMTVAFLAAVESLLSAVVADGLSGDRHKPSAEILAQGVANLVVPLFGGIPVTGAIARTSTNVRAGAQTPVASMIHALTLLVILVVLSPLASYVPLATLSAVLLVVAYNIGDWGEIPDVLRLDLADKSVWLVTFVLTVVADLTVAVGVGTALAALLYIQRVSETTTVSLVTPHYIEEGRKHALQDKIVPSYVTILRIHGPFLFGMTDKLRDAAADLSRFGPIVVLRLRNMTAIDATGLHALELLSDQLRKSDRTLILCGARSQPARLLEDVEFVQHVGQENIVPSVTAALERATTVWASRREPARSSGSIER